jgi:type I restriction-modification system DNA methylase subunit
MPTPADISSALSRVHDRKTLINELLSRALEWPLEEDAEKIDDIGYGWSQDDLRTSGLERQILDGQVWQIQPFRGDQPWGIFLLEFNRPDFFGPKGALSGATGTLRKILRGLVPSRRGNPALRSWQREHLLFLCTHDYSQFRFAYFKAPRETGLAAPLAFFGWNQGDTHVRTLCEHNLPALFYEHDWSAEDWLLHWAAAFDVEAVTRRFFAEYAAVFHQVEEDIKGVPKGEPRRLYTQRLMNRLMFLYFIQRKGWLSFQGDKHYLRALLNAAVAAKEDFLNDRLYWSFFAGLNTLNEDRKIHGHADLKEKRGEVPFLNGGLFDLEDDYDVRDKVKIPNSSFEAVLELFERYNFTVTESTPLDVEVAVDPEMLGKVFEELVTGRHETGSYYTPRPIVAFMCREALKHYLATKLAGDREGAEAAIARFVDDGDPSQLPDPEAALNALRSVKVCDPACGSGAYLLGMTQELLRLREALFATKGLDAITVYKRKLEIIQHNLYGVDIDVFAVNIAKLRLWLSLAVDFEGKTPPPLPNLDFKIERGDSLIAPDPQQKNEPFWRDFLVKRADALTKLKDKYIQTYGPEKKKLADRIKAEETKLRESLDEQAIPGAVDWRVAFAEVFRSGGFDVILANPPYVRQELIKALKPALKMVYQHLFSGTADLYVFFYLRGLQLLAPGGMLVFISSNKWFRAAYGEKLRAHIATTTTVQTIVDFHDLPVFGAIAYPMVFIAKKQSPTDDHTATLAEPPDLEPPYPDVLETIDRYGKKLPTTALGKDGKWHLAVASTGATLSKMRSVGQTLGEYVGGRLYFGIKTCLNEAWLDENGRVYIKGDKRPSSAAKMGVYVIDGKTRKKLISNDKNSAELIRPLAVGRAIKRWRIESHDQWLIVARIGVDMSRYPAVLDHLKPFRKALEARADRGEKWWELRSCAYYNVFEAEKILWGNMGLKPQFTLDREANYVLAPANVIPTDDRYLLGLLNSSAASYFFREINIARGGNFLEFKPMYVTQFPIPTACVADRAALAALAQRCLDARGVGCEAWEKEIDERVAALYGLDAAELGDKSIRPAPIYDTKGHLVHRVIPKLAKATPGFPYFSNDAIKRELEKHRSEVKSESLNHYMHELTSEGVVYDAGRGWYSTLSEPLVLDREPVRELVETLQKRFPFLEFSCWSTKQVAAYGHHQLARFTSFVYTERDAMESVADTLREAGQTVFVDPGKALIGKSVKLSDGAIVVRPLVTRAPVEGHYALAEKLLVDLLKESEDLRLMDSAEFERILRSAINSYRISISAILAYAERRNAVLFSWAESINTK